MIDHNGEKLWLVSLWNYGRGQVQFEMMKARPPFDDEGKRLEFRNRLNEINGVDIPADAIGRYPGFPLAALADETMMRKFLETLEWFVEQVRAT